MFIQKINIVIITKSPWFLPWVSIIFFLSFGIIFPQNPEWIIYNSSNSGLPHDYIQSVAIDKEGNKWIGTTRGLAKFDGDTTWTVYNMSNSGLLADEIYAIAFDSKNNKWIGTFNRGIAKFDGINWDVFKKSNSGISDNYVRKISIDKYDNIWIGTTFGGINKFDGNSNWISYDTSNTILPYQQISGIDFDLNNNIWISITYGGIAKFNGETTWVLYNKKNSKLPDNIVGSISVDHNNNIWIGSNKGLIKYDGDTTWTIYYNSIIGARYLNDLKFDELRNIWICMNSDMGGVVKFDRDTSWSIFNPSNSLLPVWNVMALAIDKYGNKWIGTYGGGLAVYREGGVVGVKDIMKVNDSNLLLFPNPVYSSFSLYEIPDGAFCYEVFDNLGIKRSEGLLEKEIDVSFLPSGIYFLKLNNQVKPIKFLKVK